MKTPKRAKAKRPSKSLPKPRKLSVRQERFCELIAAGRSGVEAWLETGYKVSKGVAYTNASESLRKPQIAARIAELRKPQTKEVFSTLAHKRRLTLEIMNDDRAGIMARLRALELDAKLAGDFAPEQHVVETGPKTLESIEERAKRVAAVLSIAND